MMDRLMKLVFVVLGACLVTMVVTMTAVCVKLALKEFINEC